MSHRFAAAPFVLALLATAGTSLAETPLPETLKPAAPLKAAPPPPPPPSNSGAAPGPQPGQATGPAKLPPRPPGLGIQAIDPLLTKYSFRGIDMTHEMRNVSLYVGDETAILLHQGAGVVSMRIKSKPYTGPLPQGAYTVGIEVKAVPCNADAKESIEIALISGGGSSVVQSCPLISGIQRCVGGGTGITAPDTRLYEIKVKPGNRQCPAPELTKLLMDVPI